MSDWAEQECRIACKKENPQFDFDSDKFDYGCSCYKSALKAYKSLCEDGHSGYSFNATKNILIRLMDGQPLTPITDEDFPRHEYDPESPWLKEQKLRDESQCPRMSSLFRLEYLDGRVVYHDNDRAYYINVEEPSDTYGSWTGFIDEMFPITMPYMPKRGKYKIYAQTFLTDKKHGDYDTKGILYVITPEGERVDLNIYKTENDDGTWRTITKEEYDELLAKRIDKLNEKVAHHLLWTLVSNSGDDDAINVKEQTYKAITQEVKDRWFNDLAELCTFFDNPDHYQYNTFSITQAMCCGESEEYKDVPELVKIADYLKDILHIIVTYSSPMQKA